MNDSRRTDGGASPLVLLDTNAWKEFFPRKPSSSDELRTLAERRATLLRAVNARRIRVASTEPLVQELSAMLKPEGPDYYRTILDFVLRITQHRALHPADERERLELKLCRKLAAAEYFRPEAHVALNFGELRKHGFALQLAAIVAAKKASEKIDERAKRDETIAELDKRAPGWREGMLPNDDAVHAFAVDWARDKMREVAARFGSKNEARWPETLPTFYAKARVHVAHVRAVTVCNYSPTDPGIYDRAHLSDACAYARVFVSNDTNLVRLADLAKMSVDVVGFAEFMQRLEDERAAIVSVTKEQK